MTRAEAGSLAGLVAVVEKFGSVVLPSRSLDDVVDADVRGALHLAGVLVAAAPAASWPCDVRGCSREIRANYDGARKPLVAVCCQAPPACGPVELAFDDVAQVEILSDALVSAACAALRAQVDRAALAKVRERRALGEARMPLLVGTVDASTPESPARDVFWAGSPRDCDLMGFCACRERVTRGSVVVVPTSKYVPLEVMARFAPGEHVEICVVDDVLCVKGGKLEARAPVQAREAPVGAGEGETRAKANAKAPSVAAMGLAARLGVSRWEEIRIVAVDDMTVRIEGNGQSLLRTFVELGFVDGRKTEIAPVIAWGLLLFLCKRGKLQPSEYGQFGKPYGAKKAVQTVGDAMREAFGLEEHPVRQYSGKTTEWVPRFRVGN